MTKRKTFIDILNSIDKQLAYDVEQAEMTGKLYPNAHTANLLYDNSTIFDLLIDILVEISNSTRETIEWFIFEQDFGRKRTIMYSLQSEHIIKNSGELYDFICSDNLSSGVMECLINS